MVVQPATVQEAALAEVLGSLPDATRFASTSALGQCAAAGIELRGGPAPLAVTTSLEELTLDTLVEAERHRDSTTVVDRKSVV